MRFGKLSNSEKYIPPFIIQYSISVTRKVVLFQESSPDFALTTETAAEQSRIDADNQLQAAVPAGMATWLEHYRIHAASKTEPQPTRAATQIQGWTETAVNHIDQTPTEPDPCTRAARNRSPEQSPRKIRAGESQGLGEREGRTVQGGRRAGADGGEDGSGGGVRGRGEEAAC